MKIEVVDVRQRGTPSKVYNSLAPANTLGFLNGGFFATRNGTAVPLGLVKIAGRTTNRRHPWKNGGVLAVTPSGPHIIPISKFIDHSNFLYALQSNVLLVEAQRNGIRYRFGVKAERSAIECDSSHG